MTDIAALKTRRQHATTRSGAISYLDVGHGRPAVFIHGLITNSLVWRNVISEVASKQRRCIAVDLPGHGHTPAAPADADVSLTGLARRVIELCDHLASDRFDLVANDTGGAVAQIVAAHLSERLSTLTLTNCHTEGNTPPAVFKPVSIAAPGTTGENWAPRRRQSRADASWPGCWLSAPSLYGEPATGSFHSSGHRLADLIPGTTRIVTLDGARMHFPDYRSDDFVPPLQQHWTQNCY